MTIATLKKAASANSSSASAAAEYPSHVVTNVTQGSPPSRSSYWTTATKYRDAEDDDPHPLVSKDSHGSSTNNPPHRDHGDHPCLVSDPSKESPAVADSTKSPKLSDKEPREWHRRPPWPLLASPGSPPTSKVIVDKRSASSTPRENVRLQPSPTNGWPMRSPMQPEHDHEVASFALFTQSFDTLSEAGQQYLRPSPVKTSATVGDGHPPRKIEVGGQRDAEMGDISPIKLDEQRPQRASVRPQQFHSRFEEHGHLHHGVSEHPRAYGAPSGSEYIPGPSFGHDEYYRASSQPATYNANGYSLTASNPFFVLRSVRKAFDQCTYKLPCLHDVEICPVNVRNHAAIHRYQADQGMGCQELEIARRRVNSAVHAFGGYTKPIPRSHQSTIFRDRKSSAKDYYDNHFHRRYFVTGDHISWELENNPPVISNGMFHSDERGEASSYHARQDDKSTEQNSASADGSCRDLSGSLVPMDSQQKMRYRCKLCGQLKQNHNCQFQQSLQRSIAVMVYPAVNAFTADEPGVLTKPLSEMNNFVSYDESSEHYYQQEVSPDHPAVTSARMNRVTPESTKLRLLHHSPESSSLSTHSSHYHHHSNDPSPHRGRKRQHVQVDATTPPSADRVNTRPTPYFVPTTLALRPEHYRAVTPRKTEGRDGNESLVGGASEEYQYPHVPLTFQERKRLSDTLFFLSKEVPTMTDRVAPLLRMAREKDEWDLAVSQILAQLVVALYCGEGDYCLDGLHRYLLGIGIAS